MHFQIDDSILQIFFTHWENTLNEKVMKGAEAAAKAMEERAKEDAPWQDRSGRARASISGEVIGNGNGGCQILLKGDTPYFSYLEFAGEGKFAVLWPTILASSEDALYILADMVTR